MGRKEAHQGLDLGLRGPEVGVQRRGRASGADDEGGWRRRPDSGRVGARPSSRTGGGGGGRCCAAPGAANRSTVTLDGRHERWRGERRARVARLDSARRKLGEREERMEMDTNVEESGEASRHDVRRDG